MTRLYQERGQGLYASRNGRGGTAVRGARRGRGKRAHGAASALDARSTPGYMAGRRDVEYQAVLRTTAVSVGRVKISLRLLRLGVYAGLFWLGVLLRRLSRTDAEARLKENARRFRALLVRLGGVMIKVGQQLSQRPDVLPAAYCDELKTLLDDLPIWIPRAEVVAAIQRQAGRPLWDVFAEFDFQPVGSASVSCVYWAQLHTGEEVAVKIRRPGIKEEFSADLEAINWLFFTMEFLTVWRPGTTRHIAHEVRDLLLEELDFRREARYQELFRRYHRKRKKLHVTAPKIYYALSGEEVMISEFVRGHSVQRIIEALDTDDEEYLEKLRRDRISPKKVAKRLVRSRYYSFHECPLFHGDPHPNNIRVLPHNKVVMLDFGACGVFSQRDRNLMWQMNHYYSRDDVAGMVNMVLLLMEPIHPINIHPFRRDLQDAWWLGFYGIKSNHAQWWERSSLRLWLRFYELIRKYKLPIPRNMVRMIRATLLYDTVAARLYGKINVFKEFQKYEHGVAKRARREIQESAIQQMLTGPDASNYLRMRQLLDIGDDLLIRARRFLDNQDFDFQALAGKVYETIRVFLRMFMLSAGAGLVGAVVAAVLYVTGLLQLRDALTTYTPGSFVTKVFRYNQWSLEPPFDFGAIQLIVVIWFVISAVCVLAYGRRIYLRYDDVDD